MGDATREFSSGDGRVLGGGSREPGILIEAVRVTGFQALGDLCVLLEPGTTVLVGENNTGKSAFLEAIATALGARQPVPDDLHVDTGGKKSKQFSVDLLLAPQSGNSFSEYLAPLFGHAIRRKEEREFLAIRTICSVGADHSILDRRRCFIEGWYGSEEQGGRETAEIGVVTERHLDPISFTLLPANRDLVYEMRRRSSRWSRLLAQYDLQKETEEQMEEDLQALGRRILDQSPRLGRLHERLENLQKAIPTVERVDLEPLPGRIDDLARSTDILLTNPTGPTLPLRMQGLGSRSLAEIMVYQAFSAELVGIDEPYSPHALSCLEEPEAHLHPQAQLAVMDLIDQFPGQSIVTTHSPQVASEAEPKQIRLFRSSNAAITVSRPSSITEEETIKLRRLVERPYGQVFFARLVIIGDGATERGALPVFAKHRWGRSPEGLGVTFVDPGSLHNAVPLIGLLEDLDIPWLVFADGDGDSNRALNDVAERIGRCLTSNSDEVVMLPDGYGFEKYLITEGLQAAIKQGIADQYGTNALAELRRKLNKPMNEDKLLLRFLKNKKGTYSAAVANAIIEDLRERGQPDPERIAELLRRADRILRLDSS